MTIYMDIDLTPGSNIAKAAALIGNTYNTVEFSTLSYGHTWAFDSSTIISVCANQDGNYAGDCTIQNFKVSNKIPSGPRLFIFSNQGINWTLNILTILATLIADYKLNEKSLVNFQGAPPGSASLCKLCFSFRLLISPI